MIKDLWHYRLDLAWIPMWITNWIVAGLHDVSEVFQDVIPILTVVVLFMTVLKLTVEGLRRHFGIDFFYFRKSKKDDNMDSDQAAG
jgi:hypothetical protein